MGAKLLEIDGTSIKFICEVKKPSTSSVHLSNISDEYVAFKVKTTSPKRFCVRPNSGIISPKSACDFSVTMQGLRSAPSDVECKDKFLIQSTVVDSEMREEDVTLELFSKSSGKYVEEKKLKVVLVSKQDSPSEEHKNIVSEKEASIKEENPVKKEKVSEIEHKSEVSDNEHKNQVSGIEHKNKVSNNEHKNKVSEIEHKNKVSETEHKNKVSENEHKNKVSGIEHNNKVSNNEHKSKVSEIEHNNKVSNNEHKNKVSEIEHKNKVSENEHKNKVSEKELPKETSIKEENLVNKEEHVPSMHIQIEDLKEAKGTEDPKSSGDPDQNDRNSSKSLKPAPVKVVKEDPVRKLRLRNQLKELRMKETSLENQLKEAKSTISSLTCENSIIIQKKEKLQLEIDRRSRKGYPFTFVCTVSLVGLISGYFSDP